MSYTIDVVIKERDDLAARLAKVEMELANEQLAHKANADAWQGIEKEKFAERELRITAERERDEAREHAGLQLAACDCAAIMDTAETHAQNKTVTRDNPSWSPAFESVMRRTAECIQLRADNARLRALKEADFEVFHNIRMKLTEACGDPYKLHYEALDDVISRMKKAETELARIASDRTVAVNVNDYEALHRDNAALRAAALSVVKKYDGNTEESVGEQLRRRRHNIDDGNIIVEWGAVERTDALFKLIDSELRSALAQTGGAS